MYDLATLDIRSLEKASLSQLKKDFETDFHVEVLIEIIKKRIFQEII